MATLTTTLNSTNVRNLLQMWSDRLHLRVASRWAPAAAAEKAARLFMTPPRIPHTDRELELLTQGRAFEVRGDRGTSPNSPLSLMAWRFGREDRPMVVLSHGWAGRGAQLRTFVPPLLAAGYQVVLFDHAGHGRSAGSASTLVHFVQGLDLVVRYMEGEGAAVVGLVGHSLGAAALGVWLNANGRELRAVLVAPPTSVERYSRYFAQRLGIPENVRQAMQARIERMLGQSWSDFELPNSVRNIRAPALVIHDGDDREVRASAGLALARAWPDARFVGTRGLGHRGVLRDAAVVRDVVDFIDGRVVFARPPATDARAFDAPAPLL